MPNGASPVHLGRTFWLAWFIPTTLFLLYAGTNSHLVVVSGLAELHWRAALAYLVVLSVILLTHQIGLAIWAWRAARRHVGARWKAESVRIATVLSALVWTAAVVVPNVLEWRQAPISHVEEVHRTIHNVAETLERSAQHPYVGIWKRACHESNGLVIAANGEGVYSLQFCGPGTCLSPGTFRPTSTIEDDARFNVVGKDQIELLGDEGSGTYYRCE